MDPNLLVGAFALGGLALAAAWRLLVWIRAAPVSPDPWDAVVNQKLSDPETPEICPHCSTPQSPAAWFCPNCGRAVGPYNNLMPYVQVFSEGEVLRNGTQDRLRKSPIILIGYFLMSLNFLAAAFAMVSDSAGLSFVMLAAVVSFWISLYRNYTRADVSRGS
jgi:hypothetical protein